MLPRELLFQAAPLLYAYVYDVATHFPSSTDNPQLEARSVVPQRWWRLKSAD